MRWRWRSEIDVGWMDMLMDMVISWWRRVLAGRVWKLGGIELGDL